MPRPHKRHDRVRRFAGTQNNHRADPPSPELLDDDSFKRWIPLLAIVAAGTIAYANSLGGIFVLDDIGNIVLNEHIRHTPIWDVLMHRRRPVVNLSLAINYAISQDRVWSYHVFNLVVHVLAGLTLFGLVRRTLLTPTFADRFRSSATWLALAVALLWTLHPLQTQSVTYIIQRGESLMGLFYLLTLYCVVRGACSARGRAWFAAAVVACALGMGSKSVMVTAPLMVVVFDRTFLSSTWSEMIRKRWALYVGLIATWSILVATGVVRGVLFPPSTGTSDVGFGYTAVSPMRYALTQAEVLLHYLRLSIWPSGLCLDYGWSAVSGLRDVWPAATVVLALLVATAWGLFRRHWLGFVGAWFFVILAPTSSFIPIKDLAFEHRMYLSLAAVVVLGVAIARFALGRLSARVGWTGRTRAVTAATLLIAVAAGLGWRTIRRNRDYHNAVDLWASVTALRPNHVRAFYNLGTAFLSDGRPAEAVTAFRRAINLYPNHVSAHYNLGHALADLDRNEEAIAEYERAAAILPQNTFQRWKPDALRQTIAQAHNSRGRALDKLGRRDEAIEAYRKAISTNPSLVRAYLNLGQALTRAGKRDEAIDIYHAALQLDPTNAATYARLGNTLFQDGRITDALNAYREALTRDPNNAIVYYNVASLLQEQGFFQEASDAYRQAIRLEPDRPEFRQALANIQAVLDQSTPR